MPRDHGPVEHALKSHAAWFTALVELASERSSEKRLELPRRITHAYLEHPIDPRTAEQYLFNEIITKLVSKIEMPGKIEAAISLTCMRSQAALVLLRP